MDLRLSADEKKRFLEKLLEETDNNTLNWSSRTVNSDSQFVAQCDGYLIRLTKAIPQAEIVTCLVETVAGTLQICDEDEKPLLKVWNILEKQFFGPEEVIRRWINPK